MGGFSWKMYSCLRGERRTFLPNGRAVLLALRRHGRSPFSRLVGWTAGSTVEDWWASETPATEMKPDGRGGRRGMSRRRRSDGSKEPRQSRNTPHPVATATVFIPLFYQAGNCPIFCVNKIPTKRWIFFLNSFLATQVVLEILKDIPRCGSVGNKAVAWTQWQEVSPGSKH